ncbi:hypothetical protein HanXRQr2_Chr01g0018601 [Helianthus annuus]|uniref:Uncharacterized protein n=1 Tax=Helianthus annuus TaxID=4232 RepID=A0A9K3JU47_HELAN|nr:hypothetical protein HanXRQr2_Chr01g0018601 [Helianthus annuus]KAJ0611378.1 hypothetical protein HanHA300_Chr01g0014971 [Helianthus annuus]KAJ0622410.1 hypothetical protein HanIR_Chr01g0020231 [Helianthus annuus]KAJ0626677.1 hypothetical protein HanHA89_Chr01g0016591 [Helianthus annuus]KAJ0783024.1 hypothetical protein HanLR1_Chr01g0015521 [Helianthus annuus]
MNYKQLWKLEEICRHSKDGFSIGSRLLIILGVVVCLYAANVSRSG